MADYKIAEERTSLCEGGFCNDIDDRGGMTYIGIARNFHGSWEGWPIIDAILANNPGMTNKEYTDLIKSEAPELDGMVKSFYKKKFWDVHRLDECESQKIANEVYDSSVNCGNGTVARWLQEDLNALNYDENPRGERWAELAEDGDIGRGTIRILNKAIKFRNMESRIYKLLDGDQRVHYKNISRRKKTQEKFMGGWLDNRTG